MKINKLKLFDLLMIQGKYVFLTPLKKAITKKDKGIFIYGR